MKRMKQRTRITTAVAVGLGLLGSPAFAGDYEVNGHAATPAEMLLPGSFGAQSGQYAVDRFGISPAVERTRTAEGSAKKCWYVLDVLLCD
jgi:hypothetical protein